MKRVQPAHFTTNYSIQSTALMGGDRSDVQIVRERAHSRNRERGSLLLFRELNSWAKDDSNQTQRIRRATAAAKIFQAFKTQSSYLDLSRMDLTTLPNAICKLTNLEDLYLDHNNIKSLPKDFGHLQKLHTLHLGNNQIEVFPKELERLQNISRLYLHQNQLSKIPSSIGKMIQITVLYLHDNKISSISPDIQCLQKLETLFLYNNRIEVLPEELINLGNLRRMNLLNNPLNQFIPQKLPQSLNSLQIPRLAMLYLKTQHSQIHIEEIGEPNIPKQPEKTSEYKQSKD